MCDLTLSLDMISKIKKSVTHTNLRNSHRYEKHVVIFWPTLLTVTALLKPIVVLELEIRLGVASPENCHANQS